MSSGELLVITIKEIPAKMIGSKAKNKREVLRNEKNFQSISQICKTIC
jgi:hypothetical protein